MGYHRKKKRESAQSVKAVENSTWAHQASTSIGMTEVDPVNVPKNDIELADTGTAGGEENIYLNNEQHLTTPGNNMGGEIYSSNDDEEDDEDDVDEDPLDDDLYSPNGHQVMTPNGAENDEQSILNEDVDDENESDEADDQIMDDAMYTKGNDKKTPQAPNDE